MMFNEVEFMDPSSRGQALWGSSTFFRIRTKGATRRAFGKTPERRFDSIVPAGDWARARNEAIACLPDGWASFNGVERAITYATAPLQAGQLSRWGPKGALPDQARQTLVDNLKFAAAGWSEPGTLSRTDQHPDIRASSLSTRSRRSTSSRTPEAHIWLQYDIYHMQIMEGDLGPTIEKTSPHRALSARRQPVDTSPDRRNQLSLPVRSSTAGDTTASSVASTADDDDGAVSAGSNVSIMEGKELDMSRVGCIDWASWEGDGRSSGAGGHELFVYARRSVPKSSSPRRRGLQVEP